MNTQFSIILSTIATITYLYFGFFILFKDKKALPNIYLFIISMLFSFWSFCYIMVDLNLDPVSRVLWNKIKFTSMIDVVFIVYLIMALTEYNRKLKFKSLIYSLIWIPVLLMLYMNYMYNSIMNDYPSGFWYLYLQFGLNGLYTSASIIILLIWHRNSDSNRVKRQSITLIVGLLAALIITILGQLTSTRESQFTLAPIMGLIWVFAFWYAVLKFRFLALTPDVIGADILSQTNDVIILGDITGRIIYLNAKGEKLLVKDEYPRHLKETISEYGTVEKLLSVKSEDRDTGISYRLNLITKNNEKLLIEAYLKIYYDRFGDRNGILLIGREVQGLLYLKNRYKLTMREQEIIQHVLTGYTHKEIAVMLGITENTLKRHMTNIFNKTGFSGKFELLNVIKQYDSQV